MEKRSGWTAFWMILPTILVISIVAFFPLFKTFYDSFYSFGLRPGIERRFVGLQNYFRLFEDTRFIMAL
ncbi:MAG: ABC-type transporter, integral membrane subunit, partial [Thermotoga petrophila]